MATQVEFLGVLFIVWGLLTTLIGLSTLALGIYALWILLNERGKRLFLPDA